MASAYELADVLADLGQDLIARTRGGLGHRRTTADPTISPSATGASVRTCSGVLMPKPTQIGRSVSPRAAQVVDQLLRQRFARR